jgi:hypothetical protein
VTIPQNHDLRASVPDLAKSECNVGAFRIVLVVFGYLKSSFQSFPIFITNMHYL